MTENVSVLTCVRTALCAVALATALAACGAGGTATPQPTDSPAGSGTAPTSAASTSAAPATSDPAPADPDSSAPSDGGGDQAEGTPVDPGAYAVPGDGVSYAFSALDGVAYCVLLIEPGGGDP